MYELVKRKRYHMTAPLTEQQYEDLSQAADCNPIMHNKMQPYKQDHRVIIIVDRHKSDRITTCNNAEAVELRELSGMIPIYPCEFLLGYIKEQSLRAGI